MVLLCSEAQRFFFMCYYYLLRKQVNPLVGFDASYYKYSTSTAVLKVARN